MTIEEKAYDEAIYNNYKSFNELVERLESVKSAIKEHNYGIAMDTLYKPYPEFQITTSTKLKESDERIRDEIVIYIGAKDDISLNTHNRWLSWLEKQGEQKLLIEKLPSEMKSIGKSLGFTTQEECDRYNQMVTDLIMSDDDKGEQKPADKVEPKFKVGDTVKDPFGGVYYIIEINNDGYKTDDGRFILFKNEGAYTIFTPAWFEKQASPVLSNSSSIGKNEQPRSDIEEAIKEVEEKAKAFTEVHKGESSDDILAQMRGEQKPAWNEEDEKNYKVLLEIYQSWSNGTLASQMIPSTYDKYLTWFKSIKDRIRPKLIWSEEDEKMLNDILMCGECHCYLDAENIAWLKSLKDRINNF